MDITTLQKLVRQGVKFEKIEGLSIKKQMALANLPYTKYEIFLDHSNSNDFFQSLVEILLLNLHVRHYPKGLFKKYKKVVMYGIQHDSFYSAAEFHFSNAYLSSKDILLWMKWGVDVNRQDYSSRLNVSRPLVFMILRSDINSDLFIKLLKMDQLT